MSGRTHPRHGVTRGVPDARAQERGRACGGPVINEDTELRDKDACRCAACGDVVPVDAAMLTRIRAADRTWRAREDREEKGHATPGPKPGRKAKPARNMPLFGGGL